MLDIGSFFERFKKMELDEMSFRHAVIDSIRINAHVDVDPDDISCSDNVISLDIPTAAKAMIFIKKPDIIKTIESKTKRRITDIR